MGWGSRVSDEALDLIFRDARSQNGWLPDPVSDAELRAAYDLAKLGPTSSNGSPGRFLFLRTAEAKARLRPFVSPGNVAKVMDAPVTAIIGYDAAFYERLPFLFPHNPAAPSWYAGEHKRAHAEQTAFRNGSLQAAYFMIAARAIGLDCGPMSGFDAAGVDREFWSGTAVRSNFLCALGRGDPAKLYPRHPRLAFEEACRLL